MFEVLILLVVAALIEAVYELSRSAPVISWLEVRVVPADRLSLDYIDHNLPGHRFAGGPVCAAGSHNWHSLFRTDPNGHYTRPGIEFRT